MEQAVIYCRSSKDRAEVGLDVQRKELKAYAESKGYAVVAEFSDMEISGSLDETARSGLRDMLEALRDPTHPWSTILALDTSRIARDPMLGLYITREAEKHGARIEYAKMPVDGSSAFGETMLSVVRAFDRLHARLSAEKGRSGLAANVAKGFRAGGIAPFGYKLQHEETGAVRGGQPVRKSRLVVDPKAARKVKDYLKARASGAARSEAMKLAKLKKPVASVIAIERNALTYAGLTVWNQRRKVKPTRDDPRRTMEWRPRSEWIVTEAPRHEALITRDEAERLLAMHEARQTRKPRVRRPDVFLLSGLLFTPAGVQWHGDAHDNAYRAGVKGRRVSAPWIEGEVLVRIANDFVDPAFLARTVKEARRMAHAIEADPKTLDAQLGKVVKQLSNLLNLGADSGDKAILEKIREMEAKAAELREQKAAWTERVALKKRLLTIDADDIRAMVSINGLELREGGGAFYLLGESEDRRLSAGELRRVLHTLVDRVVLDPKTRALTVHYRLNATPTGVKLASE
jgi:DNA invertase Pin-like site-specific DNA recombinase